MPKERDKSLTYTRPVSKKSLREYRMNRNLEKTVLLGKCQHAFSKSKQCLKNLFRFSVLDFKRNLDTDHQLGVTYLVFQKVFNIFFH